MLRTLSTSTPPRHRKSTPRFERTPSVSSNSDRDRDRRISSPRLLRQLSNPSEFFKKLSPVREKLSPGLRAALRLLNLPDLDALEERFIKSPAFLVPWAEYRDTFLLPQPSGMPRSALPGQISRRDILYAYTFFCEGKLRYDGRADLDNVKEYNPDLRPSEYYAIKKKHWGAAEYDKLLYVWLLQTFKVGKQKNPLGFRYFECLNICTAWEEVFVPIVEAVRNDYNTKGRYHYGHLAKVVEECAPSRLAFPEGNVTGENQLFRTSVPGSEKSVHWALGEINPVIGLTAGWKKLQEEEEELRHGYSQYGQLVERPKPKTIFPNWIEEQRTMEETKKEDRAAENRLAALRYLEGGEVNFSDSPSASHISYDDDVFVDRPYKSRVHDAQDVDSFKLGTESLLPYRMHQRQTSAQSNSSSVGTNPPIRMSALQKTSYGEFVDGPYADIRASNSRRVDPRYIYGHPSERNVLTPSKSSFEHTKSENTYPQTYLTPVTQLSAARPASNGWSSFEVTPPSENDTARHPSYEGSGYASPYLPTLKEADSCEPIVQEPIAQQSKLQHSKSYDPVHQGHNLQHSKFRDPVPQQLKLPHAKSFEKSRAATRIPSPIAIPPIPDEMARKYQPVVERSMEVAEMASLSNISTTAPTIPPKNPARYSGDKAKERGHMHTQSGGPAGPGQTRHRRLAGEETQFAGNLLGRIISKENIRAALSISEEELSGDQDAMPSSPGSPVSVTFGHGFAGIGGRGLNTGESPKLQTFSSHMFPRSASLKRVDWQEAANGQTPSRASEGSKGPYKDEAI